MTRRRIAIYNLYWSTYGGGEQVAGGLAELLSKEHDVTLLGPELPDVATSHDRLGIDLSGCQWRCVRTHEQASQASGDYDIFINTTIHSDAINRAAIGVYYVYFPGFYVTARRRIISKVATVGLFVLKLLSFNLQRSEDLRLRLQRQVIDNSWLHSYTKFLVISEYTKKWVQELWGCQSNVVFPLVRPTIRPSTKKLTIVSVGRFFDPARGHSKKQCEMVDVFSEMTSSHSGVGEWRLVLVGGANAENRDYALKVKRRAVGLAVDIHFNGTRDLVEKTLGAATIYWHGAGFAEDPKLHPERFEHFGIAVVEAMAAGAVPIVFGAAGPAEIVRHGVDGFHWKTLDELQSFTRRLMNDPHLCARMSAAAQVRAADFGADIFAGEINRHI